MPQGAFLYSLQPKKKTLNFLFFIYPPSILTLSFHYYFFYVFIGSSSSSSTMRCVVRKNYYTRKDTNFKPKLVSTDAHIYTRVLDIKECIVAIKNSTLRQGVVRAAIHWCSLTDDRVSHQTTWSKQRSRTSKTTFHIYLFIYLYTYIIFSSFSFPFIVAATQNLYQKSLGDFYYNTNNNISLCLRIFNYFLRWQ